MAGNPMQTIMQMMRSGVDPRQMVIQLLSGNPNLDNVGRSLLECARNNDLQYATNIYKNVAKEKGIDMDAVLNRFRNV